MIAKVKGRGKYLSHVYSYKVDGEDLPERKKIVKKKIAMTAFFVSIILLAVNLFVVTLLNIAEEFMATQNSANDVSELLSGNYSDVFQFSNALRFDIPQIIYAVYAVAGVILGFWIYSKLGYGSEEDIAYGQKGDSRWTELEELQSQYKSVPNKPKDYPGINSFKGIGGIPIAHYKNKYFIDTDTVNTGILGVSRSGKGETTITPMIDILSRAEIQSSMVLNDPKGELYAASKDTLEARGYDVQVLNLQDPMQSMSYNPLQLVVEAWIQGNPEEAAKRANSIAFTLYNDPNAGDNAFFNEGAQSAVVAIILALVEYCVESGNTDRITMGNVVDMLNELGTLNYQANRTEQKNALDEWFKGLNAGHVAKKRYGATSFAGDKTRGSILATANTGLQPFVDPLFAKMTSRNSVDLKQIGFPKYLHGQLSKDLINQRIDISFHRNDEKKTTIKKYNVKVKAQGRYSLNFDEFNGGAVVDKEAIKDGDLILIKHTDPKTNVSSKLIYKIHFDPEKDKNENIVYRKKVGEQHLPKLKREVRVQRLKNTFNEVVKDLTMKYSNNPTAVFMIVPDYDSSNHALASIFTKQLYTELSSNAVDTKGNKCFKRVQYILDEFGNMPPIDDMDQVMTVCLGRNIVFNIVLQSFTQLKRRYGEASDTIKENCQNLIYIMSKNEDTIEEVSKAAGDKTDIAISSNEHHGDNNNNINKSNESNRLITPTRLRQLLEGEQVIIRSLHRQDLKRKKVRPYPIFNTKETVMPYRFQFLSNWIDTSKELNEIDIHSEHASLELEDVSVDMSNFIRDVKVKGEYKRRNEKESAEVVIKKESIDSNKSREIKNTVKKEVKANTWPESVREEVEKLKNHIQESITRGSNTNMTVMAKNVNDFLEHYERNGEFPSVDGSIKGLRFLKNDNLLKSLTYGIIKKVQPELLENDG